MTALGGINIYQTNLSVRIIDNFSTPVSDRSNTGATFLNLFGLDSLSQNGASSPDEIIDLSNPNIVNLISGEVHFPALLPFVSEETIVGGNANASLNS